MQHSAKLDNINYSRWFYIFLFCHLFLWVVLPLLIRATVPHDTVEGIAWGFQWQLGYSKHPSLAPWLSALSVELFGSVALGAYFIAELCVVVSFWAIWRLALHITSPLYALIAVFSLEGIVYYTFAATKLTPDTVQTPVWAVLMLLLYVAIKENRLINWLLIGVFTALALWAKYQAPLIFISMFIVLICTSQGRACLKSRGPYLALLVAFIVFLPHLIWAWQNHFPEVHYAIDSTTSNPSITSPSFFTNHIITPLRMILDQLLACIGLIIMLIPFYFGPRVRQQSSRFDLIFLCSMAFGPIVLTLLYSVISGSYLVHRWSIPYFSALGLWAIIALRPQISWKKFKWFIGLFLFVALLSVFGRFLWLGFIAPYCFHNTRADAYYPAKSIASWTTRYWHQHYHRPLKYIIATHYLSAYITVYSKDRPTPYMGFSMEQSPWTNIEKIKHSGAMIAWIFYHPETKYDIPPAIKQQFPNAILLPKKYFHLLVGVKAKQVPIGFAVLPPQTLKNG